MNENTSASATRYQMEAARLAKKQLWLCPQSQAEKIGKHYCSLAIVALQLLEFCDMARDTRFDDDLKQHEMAKSAIKNLSDEIRKHHLYDFGIELEWHDPSLKDRE